MTSKQALGLTMNELAEANAEHVTTISKLEQKLTDMAVQLANAESKCIALAAENAVKHEFIKTCFLASADGASLDGADIQELGERLGLFGREIYQPVLHGYICGHEAGEDTVYVMKKTPATDVFLAEVRAQGVESVGEYLKQYAQSLHEEARLVLQDAGELCNGFAAQLRKGAEL